MSNHTVSSHGTASIFMKSQFPGNLEKSQYHNIDQNNPDPNEYMLYYSFL